MALQLGQRRTGGGLRGGVFMIGARFARLWRFQVVQR
jgi:hypothetical protein